MMVVNPPLILVSALFFLALSSVLYVASWLVVTAVLRVGHNRVSHQAQKRILMASLLIPAVLAAIPTVGGATLRHSHAHMSTEHHSMQCQQVFSHLLTATQLHGSPSVGIVVNGLSWLIVLAGAVQLLRLFVATGRLERGLAPYLLAPSPKLATALQTVAARMPHLRAEQFFECDIPAAYSSVFGLLRVRCVLSREFVHTATQEELTAVVAHEATHLASFDVQFTMVVGALNCLYFALRPVRLLARRWREAAELACDDAAVSMTDNPLAMASAILRVSGVPVLSSTVKHSLPATALAFADEAACSPSKRVERLLTQAQSASFSPLGDHSLQATALWMVTLLLPGVGTVILASPGVVCYAHCSLEAVARFLP